MTLVAGTLPVAPVDADILVLALDRIDDTLAAIRSAQAQAGVATHLFVLDQGSQRAGVQRLAEAIRTLPNAALLTAGGNLGVAGGRNFLAGLGFGRVIVALDNDAEFAAPDTVARLAAALDAEPRLAAIGCRIVTYAEGPDDLSSRGYTEPELRV
jgi:GT2 family glycosyltransferase